MGTVTVQLTVPSVVHAGVPVCPYCQALLYFTQISFCFGKNLIILLRQKLYATDIIQLSAFTQLINKPSACLYRPFSCYSRLLN